MQNVTVAGREIDLSALRETASNTWLIRDVFQLQGMLSEALNLLVAMMELRATRESAAPDLLDACKAALPFVEGIYTLRIGEDGNLNSEDGGLPFGTVDYHGMDDLMASLRAAIAKADSPPREG